MFDLQPDEGCEDGAEGADLPKCDSTYSIDIPNSSSLWEAEPRPENSSEVRYHTNFILLRFLVKCKQIDSKH